MPPITIILTYEMIDYTVGTEYVVPTVDFQVIKCFWLVLHPFDN